jgi:hypothetical protein
MAHKVTQIACTVERHLCHDPECSIHKPGASQKKPSQSVRERIELCSSFLAERGCLTMHNPHRSPKESAA